MRKAILVCLPMLISACSTYSKRQCQEMNWNQQGMQTALKGEFLVKGIEHFRAECLQENGVQPDEQALRQGYDIGLKQFCTPEYSYNFAKGGGEYAGICPAAEEAAIKPKLQEGRVGFLEQKVLDLQRQVSSLESDLGSVRSELSSAESRASSAESQLNSCQ